MPDTSDALVAALRQALGATAVLTSEAQADEHARYLSDWRQRYHGRARAIARPASTEEVATVVRLCAQHGVTIVPQGGNTGLVGGGVPDASGLQVVLSLSRLNRVLAVDAANLSMTVQAGCTLAQVQDAAAAAGLLFPLSLASEGTCTIGGNLATNAGGTQVLRYGTARELCLGLEVVTAHGEVLDALSSLRKNNTGYALRDLFIGSEGTLGIITAASLRLHPRPKGLCTALVACADMGAAVTLLQAARRDLDAGLTAFEVMEALPLSLVARHLPDAAHPIAPFNADPTSVPPPWLVLMEHTSSVSDTHAAESLQGWLDEVLTTGLAQNAALAHNEHQRRAMWGLRESIPLAEKTEGLMVKHDIGMPTSAVPAFVEEAGRAIAQRWPDARVVCFGHLGDGNLHYNVQPPALARSGPALAIFEGEVNALVFGLVMARGGTLSAEHGIGALRRDELARRADPVALATMKALKQTLDPTGLLNPGRVI
ncbi:hydroxyacid dehydrogenase [Aquabacterium olei]|uniref:Hydroxyacid dehydrogenase n=1 Tax=Aquabacterium olei TaxID=1296669 RepID=A0A2U8FSQ3_9BURK|nr:FAD-binding oxidoreductase [Aquabacterium olei]AWI53917.1 hydroxyacid dehydrogenase [Aquabacterium olei]